MTSYSLPLYLSSSIKKITILIFSTNCCLGEPVLGPLGVGATGASLLLRSPSTIHAPFGHAVVIENDAQ